MAVQRGRSKRGGEAYSFPYVESLSAARTKLADIFNLLQLPSQAREQRPQLQRQAHIPADAKSSRHRDRRPIQLPVQDANAIFSRQRQGDVRLRMRAARHSTGAVVDLQVILSTLCAAQVELIHSVHSFGRLGIELAGQQLKEIFDCSLFMLVHHAWEGNMRA